MPLLTIPPQPQTHSTQSSPPAQLPPIVPPDQHTTAPDHAPTSPVAPEFSPITPKAKPAIPATYSPQTSAGPEAILGAGTDGQHAQNPLGVAPTARYIPQPPPQPFSSEDATDAIALRAAISSLQFQKKKAQDDIRALEKIKNKALDEPVLFRTELAGGRLKEQSPKVGNLLQSILDEAGSDDDDDEVVFGGSEDTHMKDSEDSSPPFGQMPGPQNVVRMPYVNWDKYHISGEPLDALHEQQRKWPGSFSYRQDRGREQAVAAPYSPWLDPLESQQQAWDAERRNDSVTTPGTAVTPTGIVSEHPMETRRKQMFQ